MDLGKIGRTQRTHKFVMKNKINRIFFKKMIHGISEATKQRLY